MITLLNYEKDQYKIHYKSLLDAPAIIRLDVIDNKTNSIVNSNLIEINPDLYYWAAFPNLREDSTIIFYENETGRILSSYTLSGEFTTDKYDYNGYLKKVQSFNSREQQVGLNKLLDEYLFKDDEDVIVESNDIVVDIGFGYGLFTIDALKKGASKIYGFDADKTLCSKLSVFPHSNKVKIYNCGISNIKKTTNFYEDADSISSSFSFEKVNVSKVYEVDCLKLEDALHDEEVNRVHFLNVDCSGDEYDIIGGMSGNFLKKVDKIRIKYYNNISEELNFIIDKLKKNNFEIYYDQDYIGESGIIFAKKIIKNIVLISSYCDTKEKSDILLNNLKIIKSNGLDVAVISPLALSDEILKNTDYFFLTKENIVLSWPIHAMYDWKHININNNDYLLTNVYDDYGFSGLQHVKRLGEIFINYDYDFYSFIIYDTVIDDNVISFLRTGHSKIVFPSQRGEEIWKVGLHLMCFDKGNLRRVISRITIEDYLNYKDFDAFAYLHNHIVIPLGVTIGDFAVRDHVYFYENIDKMNFSDIDGIKYFIISNDKYSDVSIFFYDLNTQINVKTLVNGIKNEYVVRGGDIIDLGVTRQSLVKGVITINGVESDFTRKVKNIKISNLENKTI